MFNDYLQQINNRILTLPRTVKRIIIISIDAFLFGLSVLLSILILNPLREFYEYYYYIFIIIFISLILFYLGGLYNSIFRYINVFTFRIAFACLAISSFTSFLILDVLEPNIISYKIIILYLLFSFLMIFIFRSSIDYFFNINSKYNQKLINTLIYGAGSAGIALSSALANNNKYKLKGFIDDDESLIGNYINGYLVINPKKLKQFIKNKKIKNIIIAIPSLSKNRKKEIFNQMILENLNVRSLPYLNHFNGNTVNISDIQEIEIDNIIRRKSSTPNKNLMKKTIENFTVLVTGAGGSIGFELCQQIVNNNCRKIILLEINEFNLYKINEALENLLKHLKNDYEIISVLGSICDRKLVRNIIKKHKPRTIFHTAAYKHVNIVEENKIQGITNNILGTYNIAEAAFDFKIKNFILISSDKAVRPTNMMGATKRLSEIIIQSFANKSLKNDSIFSMVRFGNVIGSSGSVIPKFNLQIKNGGPVTVTHKKIIRYFMTIDEAVELVIQASAIAKGGEVFLLDMKEPIKILDIAIRLIRSYGYSINEKTLQGDIPIKITGLKPGEKLYEELLINKNAISTLHPHIFKANEPFISYQIIDQKIDSIRSYVIKNKDEKVVSLVESLIPEYTPYQE